MKIEQLCLGVVISDVKGNWFISRLGESYEEDEGHCIYRYN